MNTEQEIQKLIEQHKQLEGVVDARLHQALDPLGMMIHITHRVKTMESIRGKLVRKPDLYQSADDLRDILGFRVICYFSKDVDVIANILSENFRVDWTRSKDKRKLIDAKSFGYLSLHFICALPEEDGELSNLWFEVQIRTILQHSWAEIEHDLGYKTEIEVPRNIRRSFSRAASLLETTDIIFSEIRKELEEYTAKAKADIENERIEEVYFDRITLAEFTSHNKTYLSLLQEIAAITGAQIKEGHLDNLFAQIEFLGIRTFGDMIRMIEENRELALQLAKQALQYWDLDELTSTVGYYYLFRARLISGGFSRERVREFFMLTSKNERRIERNTDKIMQERETRQL